MLVNILLLLNSISENSCKLHVYAISTSSKKNYCGYSLCLHCK